MIRPPTATGRLADALLLHAAETTGGRPDRWRTELGLGAAGAVLVDLAFIGRVAVRPDGVTVRSAARVEDPVADGVLGALLLTGRGRCLEGCVEHLAPSVYEAVLARLLTEGRLECVRGRFGARYGRCLPTAPAPTPPHGPHADALAALSGAVRRRPPGRRAADGGPAVEAVCAAVEGRLRAAAQTLTCPF
ncbi:GPP34 family phosphoprotein [Streptomyces sp. WMMC897]|uniref:GPP34 family phosphoprotein n=1 Tax=Streptomyces sp. WMMC897 TaxID=3014782 RepID=UPI0022B67142|nr:GPP34 family phosphoprotein [Streptomyces sp. WMMC897]MCZ7415208.1 GPP34 family phosphoprotein [Streptomyces sp. WMMC897]